MLLAVVEVLRPHWPPAHFAESSQLRDNCELAHHRHICSLQSVRTYIGRGVDENRPLARGPACVTVMSGQACLCVNDFFYIARCSEDRYGEHRESQKLPRSDTPSWQSFMEAQ